MNVFYNRAHLGDVLIIDLEEGTGEPTLEKKKDAVLIRLGDKLVGINLFNASHYRRINNV